jgi:hypothetical protein
MGGLQRKARGKKEAAGRGDLGVRQSKSACGRERKKTDAQKQRRSKEHTCENAQACANLSSLEWWLHTVGMRHTLAATCALACRKLSSIM